MRRFPTVYSSPWRHTFRHAPLSRRSFLLSSPTPPTSPSNGISPSDRAVRISRILYSTSPAKPRRRLQLRFRPIPTYGILLVAQFILAYFFVQKIKDHDGSIDGEQSVLLNTSDFTSYTLVRKEVVSENSCILTLQPTVTTADWNRPPTWSNPYSFIRSWVRNIKNVATAGIEPKKEGLKSYQDELWKQGVWSVEIKQPQLMIARRYTPLPPETQSSPTSSAPESTDTIAPAQPIRLFVRREPQGEVSRYLHNLPDGTTVDLRGGFLEYKLPHDVSEVVFIAGGTGIAPALGIVNNLSLTATDARIQVLWANRRREDCIGGTNAAASNGLTSSLMQMTGLKRDVSKINDEAELDSGKSTLVRQLTAFQHPSDQKPTFRWPDVAARYFVDEEGTFIRSADIAKALQSSKAQSHSDGIIHKRRLVLVSGPDGFVEHIAGPNILRNGAELQGGTGGLLAHVDLKGWEVRKL